MAKPKGTVKCLDCPTFLEPGKGGKILCNNCKIARKLIIARVADKRYKERKRAKNVSDSGR